MVDQEPGARQNMQQFTSISWTWERSFHSSGVLCDN